MGDISPSVHPLIDCVFNGMRQVGEKRWSRRYIIDISLVLYPFFTSMWWKVYFRCLNLSLSLSFLKEGWQSVSLLHSLLKRVNLLNKVYPKKRSVCVIFRLGKRGGRISPSFVISFRLFSYLVFTFFLTETWGNLVPSCPWAFSHTGEPTLDENKQLEYLSLFPPPTSSFYSFRPIKRFSSTFFSVSSDHVCV